MWRKLPAALAGAGLVLSLSAAAAPPALPLMTSGDQRTTAPPGTASPAVAVGITRLGHDLRTDGNFVASPLSVAYAYGMVRAGLRGAAAARLDGLFGVPGDDLHPALSAIMSRVPAKDVRIANGLFVDRGYPVQQPFLRTLATRYGTGVHPADLGTPRSGELINQWVRQRTGGRIPGVYRPRPNDKVVLVNAIHLKADWAKPFTASEPMPFTRAGAGSVSVPAMQVKTQMPYARGAGWQAVDVAYSGDDLVMRILLPDLGRDPADLLEPGRLSGIGAAMRPRNVNVHLPKWETRSSYDLLPLGHLNGADLGGIAPGLRITSAEHQAWIRVDEKGTEAAAATGVVMGISALASPEVEFRADRPFAYVILHRPTGVPLFTGQVADPSA